MSIALVVLGATAAFGFGRTPGEMRDFEVYWTAAGRAAAAEPLYRAEDGHYQFKYLPAFAVAAAPVSRLSLDTARRAWFVVSVALVCALLALSLSILPHRHRPAAAIVSISAAVMGKFYGHELVLGQVNLLFAVLAAAGIHLLIARRITGAVLLFVAALVIKPYAVLFVPWLIALHGGRALAPLLLGGLAVLAAPVPLYGVGDTFVLHQHWWTTVTASTAPNLTNPDNVSLAAFFAKWLGQGVAATASATLAAGICLFGAVASIRRGREMPGREALEGSLLLVLIPLLSPQGWDYVFLIATPAVALAINYADGLARPMRVLTYVGLGIVGLSLFDVLGRQRYATFMAWSVITACFIVLFAALVALRQRRSA